MRDLASKMKVGHQRLWQGIFANHFGGYTGFFPGTDQAATDLAVEIAGDLAVYLKCYLMRQGWKMITFKKLIKKSFDETAADNAQLAKWDSNRGKLISGALVKQAQHNAMLDKSFIDQNLGRAKWEIARDEKLLAEDGEMGAEMSELRPGSMGAFDYTDEQSAKTAISGKTAKTYKFDAVSKFTAGSDESMGWGSDASQGEENDEDGMTGVQFELPEGGIGNNNNGSQVNDRSGNNEDDAISINSGDLPAPSNLNDKFGDTMDTEETKEDDKMEDEENNDTQRDCAKNTEAAKPPSNNNNTPAGNALQHAMSTI